MKQIRTISWIAIILLFFLNALILLNRNKGFKYFPYKSYNELYVTDSTLYLTDINFNNGTAELSFSQNLPDENYQVVIDDSVRAGLIKNIRNKLHIPLRDSMHTYKLADERKTLLNVVVEIDHSKNSHAFYTNELLYCNLPGPQIKVSSYLTWTMGIKSFSPKEVKNGRAFLRKNTRAFFTNSDFEKVIELCRIMSLLRPNRAGMLAAAASLKTPYEQLTLAMQQKINLDCGNYSAMLHYLCSLLNIPNRVVTFSGPAGNWQYGVHYYNEVYLREKQQWVLCDGVSNAYMPHDSLRFYNAADVKKMAQVNGFANKYVYTFNGNSLRKVTYDSLNYWHWYYNRNNANLCYLHPGSGVQDGNWNYFKDFYSFARNFDFYSDTNRNNWLKIIMKMAAFYLMLLIAFVYLAWEIKLAITGKNS